jgi:hypothetical protein
MNMTKLSRENRELNCEDLDGVAGGMPFYGMNCSLNQQNAIGGIVDGLGSIPIVGGFLAGLATVLGRAYCS